MNETNLHQAWRLVQAGNLDAAARIYRDVLRANPANFEALAGLGLVYLQAGSADEAQRILAEAAKVNGQSPEVFFNRGCALQALGRNEEALACFARALALRPDYMEARNNRGNTLLGLERYAEALACFERVVEQAPNVALVHSNRAAALLGLERNEEALASAQRAIALDRNYASGWYHRGAAYAGLNRFEEALADFDRALALTADYVEALQYRGIVLSMLGRYEDAVAAYDRAVRLRPGNIELLYNRSTALLALKRFEDAIPDCEKVLTGDPGYKYARGNLLHCRLQCCDWTDLEKTKAELAEGLRQGRRVMRPLLNMVIGTDESDQLRCSRIWVANDCPPVREPLWKGERYQHDRIRLAYVSSDFRDHAVATLAAGMFEHHDKTRFETIALSLGSHGESRMRKRLAAAFEHFLDVRSKSDAEVAQTLKDMEIDIAVDLMGFTEGARTGIFARKAVPIQVSHIGFPGTMGADYIDYILADPTVLPAEQQRHYCEKVVTLPDCYLPNDDRRAIPPERPSRAEAGLPDHGVVFCAFNNLYKLTPEIFGVWLRLLAATEGSVLWLSQASPAAMRNLRREGERARIAPGRMVFAPFAPDAGAHLARLSLADLFLDTVPYNAHASACDALWAGVPVVTCKGTTFAGRVGASTLTALGMPELVTKSLEDYEWIAKKLANDPTALSAARAKLAAARGSAALFDTGRFTRNLESAFAMMVDRHQRGLKPAALAVERLP
jgi:predicted O-linked N-acetylglucosamine transferase (SPINDLY family)